MVVRKKDYLDNGTEWWFTSLIPSMRGALGSVRNRKTAKKKKKTRQNKKTKKNLSTPKTACKTDKFSHSSFQTLIDPIQRWQVKQNGFRGYERPVEAKNCRLNRIGTGIQIGKTENHIRYQIRKPMSIFDEDRKPNAKKR